MANKLPVLDEGQKGLNEMIRLLKEVQAEIVKTSQLMRETPKNTFDLKTPKEANAILQKRVQISEQTAAALKEQDRLERNLISQIEKNKTATESTNRALIKHRYETQQVNRAIKEETILNSRLSSEYQKLVVRMNQTGRVVQNLTAKKEQGLRLTRKEQAELKRAQREFTKYNRAVIKADASIKRFQRNVANYSSAFGKAQLALRTFAGVFGVLSAASIARDIFTLVKEVDSLEKSLLKVTETQELFNRAQSFTKNLAQEAGVEINGLRKSYVKFLASAKTTNLTLAETEDIFRQTAKAGAVLGLSNDDINGSFRALEQILSKGKVQAEEIRGQLGERLPGAFQILAKSMGLTTQQLSKQLELGNVISEEVLPNFARELEKTFGLDKVSKVDTLIAAQNRLQNSFTEYISASEDAVGGSQKLIKILEFLADNLGVIINTIITVVKWFGIYKGVVLLARLQTALMNRQLLLTEKAALSSAKGVSKASFAFSRFNKVLKANILGITVLAIGGLIWVYNRLSKSIVDTAKELNESSKEFTTQHKETQKVNDELNTMVSRYDELKGKTNLNAKEQKELNTIIETIGKTVPDAVTEIDKYGKALEINTGKVKEFTERNKEASLQLANTLIADQSKVLKTLERDLSNYDRALGKNATGINKTNGLYIEGIGTVEKLNNKFTLRNKVLRTNTALTTDQNQKLLEYVNGIESSIVSTKNSIKANQDVINSISGVTAAQEEQNKVGKDKDKDKDTDPTPDSSVSSRGAAYNAKLKEFEAIKLFNQQILNDEKSTGAERLIASNSFYKAEKDLLDLNKNLAIRQAKGNADKLVDIGLKYDRDILNNEQKREDAAFKILEDSFKEKLNLIKDAQDAVKIEMQAAIDAENKIFLESERTPKDVERLEKAILEIKKQYAIKELQIALEKTRALAAAEQDPLRKAELLRAAATLESSILQLQSDHAIDILKSETEKTVALEKLKQEAFDQTARVLSDSLGLSEEKLNRFFDAFSKESSALEKIGASLALVGDIGSAIHDKKIQEYEYEIEANNEKYEALLDNEKLSEEQRSALEAERERKNAELEKKKRAEQTKQAKLNKAFAIFEAVISTAAGVTKALPDIPLAILTGVLGAVQVAAIAAQPIPKYKHGRTGGDAEFAYVGDGGVSEVIARAGGGYEITPNRETLTYLNKGDSVLPDASKFLHEQAYNMSISSQGRSIERIQVNNGLTKVDIDRQTQSLIKAMSQNKTSVRVHNNNTIGADLKFLNRLNDVL